MPNLPDFTLYGYQTLEILYQNTQGGRITYKAHDLENNQTVVIKQFSFAKKTWDGYKEIEREINVLSSLNHAGIPKYLNKFDSDDGLCLVQEYKNAQPLSTTRSFSAEEVKSIATQLLEILVYLQQRIPPIIHRDIKPENVLVTQIPPSPPYQRGNGIRVYLIDFGLARIGNNTMAFSTMQGGTLGFMPPEQVHNQKLTEASDLYGLGATLICLISNTQSMNIGSLVDFSTNKINFKEKVPKFSLRFIQWLEKMVEPNPANRYENAEVALDALKPLYVIRLPEVNLDKLELNFVADKLNQKLSQTITISNNIPDTILEGNWSVSAHKNDPPHTPDSHSWISFSPRQFKGNQVNCEVKVDTSKLKTDKDYEREIVLISNAKEENYYTKVKVKTAKLNIPLPPYLLLVYCGLIAAIIAEILGLSWLVLAIAKILGIIGLVIFVVILGLIDGVIRDVIYFFIAVVMVVVIVVGIVVVGSESQDFKHFGLFFVPIFFTIIKLICAAILVKFFRRFFKTHLEMISKAVENSINKILTRNFYDRGFKDREIKFYVLTTTAVGILTGLGIAFGFSPLVLTGLGVAGIPLGVGLIMPPLKLRKLKAEYRRQESQNLIDS